MTKKKTSTVNESVELRERVAIALWVHHGAMLDGFRMPSDWLRVPRTAKLNMLRLAEAHIKQMRYMGVAVENRSAICQNRHTKRGI